jgi:hypothetical protein
LVLLHRISKLTAVVVELLLSTLGAKETG